MHVSARLGSGIRKKACFHTRFSRHDLRDFDWDFGGKRQIVKSKLAAWRAEWIFATLRLQQVIADEYM